jgi:hypothetical protein
MKFLLDSGRAKAGAYISGMSKNTKKPRRNSLERLSMPADRRATDKADAEHAWREYLRAQESEHEKTARLRAARLAREKAAARRKQKKSA